MDTGMAEINYKTSTVGLGKKHRIKTVESDIEQESQTNQQPLYTLSSNPLREEQMNRTNPALD